MIPERVHVDGRMKQHASNVEMNLNIWFARGAFEMVTGSDRGAENGEFIGWNPGVSRSVGCYVLQ